MKKKLIALAVAPLAATAVLATAAPASADWYGDNPYSVCYKNSDCNMGFSAGQLEPPTLLFPDVRITGKVVNREGSTYSTTVVFETYNGSTKTGSDTRTSRDGTKTFDPVYVGDFDTDRVKITVCQNWSDGTRSCGTPVNYSF